MSALLSALEFEFAEPPVEGGLGLVPPVGVEGGAEAEVHVHGLGVSDLHNGAERRARHLLYFY